jgi:hypothetical protein
MITFYTIVEQGKQRSTDNKILRAIVPWWQIFFVPAWPG